MSATRAAVHQPAASGAAPEHAAGDAISIVKLVNRRAHVAVTWGDGHLSRFHAVWLRDNCHCAACRDPQTGQRLIDIATLPDEILINSSAAGAELSLTFTPEAHRGRIPSAWLRAHCYATESRHARLAQPRLWDSQISNTLPEANHAEVMAIRASLGLWLALIQTYGFALLRGVPLEDGQVVSIAALFGFVRETNYGRFFDVRTRPTANNLAFTGHALGAHTDNPYRDPVPGLQLLHCLEAGAEGGESVLVDGFHAAELLRRRAPEQFALLSRYEVPFRFSDAECDLRARGPLIEIDHDGVVSAVRYNNRSADALDLPTDIVPDFYEAYRHFGRRLGRPDGLVVFRMAPGDLLLLNNRRVLHGRRGFAASASRHLQGCYVDGDALDSLLRKIGP